MNNYVLTYEEKKKATLIAKYNTTAQFFAKCVKALEAIIPIAEKQKGKVINVKLLNAFQEATDRATEAPKDLYVYRSNEGAMQKEYSHEAFYFEYYFYGNMDVRSFRVPDGTYSYIEDKMFYFRIYAEADKRLNWEETQKYLASTLEAAKKRVNDYKDLVDNFDKYMERRAEIKKAIETFEKEVPYLFRSDMGIRY